MGTERYKGHLPFQVFCCESGTHVVDPEQSYYRDISYRASPLAHNISTTQEQPDWDPETQCMDSTQMWFCRDLWTDAARGGLKEGRRGGHKQLSGNVHKRSEIVAEREFVMPEREKRDASPAEGHAGNKKRQFEEVDQDEEDKRDMVKHGVDDFESDSDSDFDVERRQLPGGQQGNEPVPEDEQGTDVDAIDEDPSDPAPEPFSPADLPASAFLIPNSAFTPARILVNPRCVTTYGGVSHTQLALDLFGGTDEEPQPSTGGNYVLDDWAGPPDSFVCQEMRTTGGRTAPKSQRRVGFLLQNEVSDLSPCRPVSQSPNLPIALQSRPLHPFYPLPSIAQDKPGSGRRIQKSNQSADSLTRSAFRLWTRTFIPLRGNWESVAWWRGRSCLPMADGVCAPKPECIL
jgi:hypothetical protein